MAIEVPIRLSNHHIHLTDATTAILFGGAGLTFMRYLDGEGDLVAHNETVELRGPKGSIAGVRVLGPNRKKDQVELLTADCYRLGVDAPVRMSGNLEGAATLTVVGPCGQVELPCGIVAHRHIHVHTDTAKELNLTGETPVSVRVGGVRGVVFDNVMLKISPKKTAHGMMMHIDTEEGNAAGLKNNGTGTLLL